MGPMALTLAVLALMGGAYAGWGALVARAAGIVVRPWGRVWLGWAASLLFFQLWNLLLPVDLRASVLFAVIGLTALALGRPPEEGLLPWQRALLGLGTLLFAVAAGGRAMLAPTLYDTGLYHLSAIRWATAYPIVPGLANLHGRLGFNQSYFLYAASLDGAPLARHGHHFATLFLFVLTFAHCAATALRRSAALRPRAVAVLGLAVLVRLATRTPFSSPAPDDAIVLLQLALFLQLLELTSETDRGRAFGDAMMLAILAAAAITVKLSALGFAAGLVAVTMFVWYRRFRPTPDELRRASPSLAIVAALGVVWLLRGVILSGCAIYPVAQSCLDLSWSVPLEKVAHEARWIRAWARAPGLDPHAALGSSAWLSPWLERLQRHDLIVFACGVFAIAAPAAAAVRWRHRDASSLGPLLIAPAAGLAWWFFTAPDPRFALGLFILLAIAAAAQLTMLLDRHSPRAARWLLAAVLVATLPPFAAFVTYTPLTGFRPTAPRPLVTRTTASGLQVFVPRSGDRVWDAPLPATPELDPNLRLRGEGLGGGFTVRPPH